MKIELFKKIECLVKAVKKCVLKKLNIWLALIKSLRCKLPKGTNIYIYIYIKGNFVYFYGFTLYFF